MALTLLIPNRGAGAAGDALDRCNVEWNSPSADSGGSMPLGNGDIGLNLWVEQDGDLLFYLSKTDAWSETGRLLKLGRVRISLAPNPFQKGNLFRQTLRLRDGEVEILAGEGDSRILIRAWVDANNPVVRIELESPGDFETAVSLESWRLRPRVLATPLEVDSAYGLGNGPITVDPDTILPNQPDRITWFHHNTRSIWGDNLKLQGLEGWSPAASDPLLGRIFGGVVLGDGLVSHGPATLNCARPSKRFLVSIHVHTAQGATTESWLRDIGGQVARLDAAPLDRAREAHRQWWHRFWQRSWIYVSGTPEAEAVARGYVLQRFINACGGRGAYPIKFNGSIFTVDAREPGEVFDADYRRWGGPYWFQNTRLAYWPMLASGDFDLMQPFFRMYLNALPLARERTRRYFGHGGAFFPETMYFWGAYTNDNYGWDRQGKPASSVENPYIRYLWQGGLELGVMMLEYYSFTQDEEFLKGTLLPLARAVVEFYDHHYPRDPRGKIRISPACALETWSEAVDPMPEIAGLMRLLDGLLALSETSCSPEERREWQRFRAEIPPLPESTERGVSRLLPAEQFTGHQNSETPELYAVFPYRLLGVGRPNLEIAIATFGARASPGSGGWKQDAIQAALLGLTDEARRGVVHNFSTPHAGSRFPAFWGPNADWVPDQDHGGVAAIALQSMLLQAVDQKIILFPAWPRDWDVDFKLHAPGNTTVEARYRSGKLEWLHVTPPARKEDVVIGEEARELVL